MEYNIKGTGDILCSAMTARANYVVDEYLATH